MFSHLLLSYLSLQTDSRLAFRFLSAINATSVLIGTNGGQSLLSLEENGTERYQWPTNAGQWLPEEVYMIHVTRKPVFRVCNRLRLKLACSADETSLGLEISAIVSRGITLSQASKQQWRWSDCADAQADLRLCCSHMV